MNRLRILNLPLELPTLAGSKMYGYSMGIGLHDAFVAAGADVLTIPAVSPWPPDHPPVGWLAQLREIIGDRKFDQAWIEIQYTNFNPELLEYLCSIAPVRVGLMTESRVLFPGEYGDFFNILPATLEKRLPYLTHVLFPDEKDVDSLSGVSGTRAVFLPIFVNSQFVNPSPPPLVHDKVTFMGRLLRDRELLLGHPSLKGMIEHVQATGEEDDDHLRHFDAISRFFTAAAENAPRTDARADYLRGGAAAQLEVLRSLKRRSQSIMMRALSRGIANLNLRSYSALFSSRVFETIAAGQCVITYRVPDRPRTNALFEEGKEILFFDESRPESLAEQISFLRSNPGARQDIIRRSQAKLLALHTTEQRIAQLLRWIETGDAPRYG